MTNLHVTHEHAHASHEICTDEAELNPCHRAIYHHDSANGCKHPGHIQAIEQDCELCAAICIQKPIALTDTWTSQNIEALPALEQLPEAKLLSGDYQLLRSRGPPLV